MKRGCFAALVANMAFTSGALAQAGSPLPALGADLRQTTVSGISSGGFMAAQLATAYSRRIAGVGVVAAGPFYCAHTYDTLDTFENATNTCMAPFEASVSANAATSWKHARAFAHAGKIDPVQNLARQRVYVFSGARDDTVKTMVVDHVEKYYILAGAQGNIVYTRNADAGHAFSTAYANDQACGATGPPYINNCGFMQAHELLRHLYPERTKAPNADAEGKLIRFDQKAFIRDKRSGMAPWAWVYVPTECQAGGCAVHVAFHGCRQGASEIGDRFYKHVGYNELADTNRLIVLYPQVQASRSAPFNPRGCWDFWGYSNGSRSGDAFATREAPQMAAVMAMIARLGRKP